MNRPLVAALAALGALTALNATSAAGCEAQKMATTGDGFIHKVVAGSDKIKVFKTAEAKEQAYLMELLQPYFVICESGDYFKITDVPADTVEQAMAGRVGFVAKAQTHLWPTREALSFSDVAFLEERPEIVAWEDELVLKQFMESGDKKLHPPAFQENLDSTRKRERSTRPYPVLDSKTYRFRNVADKRVYQVLLPAALRPTEARIEIPEADVAKAKTTLKSATILVVFDATASMGPFASETAKSIAGAINGLDPEVVAGSTMGFVFFRDADDNEKLVEVAPIPIADAAKALQEAAGYMTGGGDSAEPVLDAVYYATNLFKWGQASKRIMIVVLNDDAKPATEGAIDPKGRIPAGMDVNQIVGAVKSADIPVITVQAGENLGKTMEIVLQSLGAQTGGQFIRWEPGSTQANVAKALAIGMANESVAAIGKGTAAVKELKPLAFDLTGYASIPLEVLDGEMLDRLRRAGVAFNINPGEGGVLVREGYIVENNDLLEPRISIEKQTLQGLINLYSVLATTGLDSQSFLRSAGEAIAAIAGEGYDEKENISEIIRKNIGVQFRSELLNFNLEYLDTLNPAERLKYTKRIQDAGNKLAQHLEANLAEFDSLPTVWMPVSKLP